MRWLARTLLAAMLAGSVALTAVAVARIAANPALTPLRAATAAEIVAATDRMMAQVAPERIVALAEARLDEAPRNWVALDALAGAAAERGLALPGRFATLRAQDFGWAAQAGDCAACLWDIAACTLSNVLICKVPVLMTPVEDLRGIVKAGVDWGAGGTVDRLDLGLSVVGLGATAAIVASGGTSATVKAGTALVRAARGMRLLSPRLAGFVADTARAGLDMGALVRARRAADLAQVVRGEALAPLVRLAGDLGRMRRAAGTAGALHLLRLVDSGDEARRLADAAAALGPRTVGRAEVLGKARLMRATVRLGGTAWAALAGMIGLMLSVAAAIGGMMQTALMRVLRRRI